MTGERIVFCILAIIVMCFPMKAKAQALPDLSSTTISQLQVIRGQAETLAMAQEGLRLPTMDPVSIVFMFSSLYKGLQAWNEWQGGEDYLIRQKYQMERQNMPEWLAQLSGDYVFWEIEYFGETLTLITDMNGDLVSNNNAKAVNVKNKPTNFEAVQSYKTQNNNSFVNMPTISSASNYAYDALYQQPQILGNDVMFFLYQNGQRYRFLVSNYTNAYCALKVYETGGRVYTIMYFTHWDNSTPPQITALDGTFNNLYIYNNSNINIEPSGNVKCSQLQFFTEYWNPSPVVNFPCLYLQNISDKLPAQPTRQCNSLGPLNGSSKVASPPVLSILITTSNGQEVQNIVTKVPTNTEISAESLNTIVDAIAEVEPQTDPQTGIEIIEIPQNFPVPETVPLEIEPEIPPIPEGIQDFPQSDPEIAPPYDPSIDPATTPTEDTLPDSAEEIQPMEELQLVTGLQNRFPFSIPWDIYNAYKMLQAEREIPHWEWEMSVNLPGGEVFTHTFVLDLEFIDPVVGLFRDLFLLAFILGLAIYSYNKFFGGGA